MFLLAYHQCDLEWWYIDLNLEKTKFHDYLQPADGIQILIA